MGRGALQATAHGVAESDTTKQLTTQLKGDDWTASSTQRTCI